MIVLDTHAWVWWVSNPASISLPARKIIDSNIETVGAPLVTKDERILNYPHVETIW